MKIGTYAAKVVNVGLNYRDEDLCPLLGTTPTISEKRLRKMGEDLLEPLAFVKAPIWNRNHQG